MYKPRAYGNCFPLHFDVKTLIDDPNYMKAVNQIYIAEEQYICTAL